MKVKPNGMRRLKGFQKKQKTKTKAKKTTKKEKNKTKTNAMYTKQFISASVSRLGIGTLCST